MNVEEKNKLNHDFLTSVVIINSISKSASTFIDKISDKNIAVTDKQMQLFKGSMSAIQHEMANIENIFRVAMSE